LATVGLAASETIETSQTSSSEGRPAIEETPATEVAPTTVLALAFSRDPNSNSMVTNNS